MVSLTPPGATAATYSYDALGRPATRSIASASLTYAYIGSTARSYATIPNAGSATYALIDADASRLALNTGGTTAWTTFDLHGDLAATTAAGSATIVSALRHDAYGATLDTYTAASGATEVPWRYQGRLDLSPDPDEPLYDAGARRYRPSLGAFTALDTYPGSALNPLSLNRYLYAHANPTSLIDPTGHCVTCPPMLDGAYTLPTQGANAPVSAAAAQSQVAAATSWAPASATSGPAAATPTWVSVFVPPALVALELGDTLANAYVGQRTLVSNAARALPLGGPTGSVASEIMRRWGAFTRPATSGPFKFAQGGLAAGSLILSTIDNLAAGEEPVEAVTRAGLETVGSMVGTWVGVAAGCGLAAALTAGIGGVVCIGSVVVGGVVGWTVGQAAGDAIFGSPAPNVASEGAVDGTNRDGGGR